jgi:uroporphyrinogen-III synthase
MAKRIVLTRPAGPYKGGRKLATKLIESGFEVFELTLQTCLAIPISGQDRELLAAAFLNPSATWAVFLSPTSVWVWRDLVDGDPVLVQAMNQISIAVQGVGTAEALSECFGYNPSFMPTVFVADQFARQLAAHLNPGDKIIIPQSADGRDVFGPTLKSLGFKAYGINTYQLRPAPPSVELLDQYRQFVHQDTVIVFMSPSAVKATFKAIGPTLGTDKVLSIGPITSSALKSAGLPVWREAREHSEAGILEVLGLPRSLGVAELK